MPETKRILSVQSHVASGYVGNRAATFPLQYLGYDVDVINTCQLSCHTQYDAFPGYRFSAEQLEAIFDGLEANHLCDYDYILTGYIPGGEGVKAVGRRIRELKKKLPNVVYLLDPVMGDSGRLYVQADTIDVYRGMLDLATIITPNHFELELLSETSISSMRTMQSALLAIHTKRNVPHIVVSSTSLPVDKLKQLDAPIEYTRSLPDPLPSHYVPEDAASDGLLCLASSWHNDQQSVWAFRLPTIKTSDFTGTGDFFSAMVLAHFRPASPDPLRHAVARATLLVQHLLLQTYLYSCSRDDLGAEGSTYGADPRHAKDAEEKARWTRIRELRLIQNANLLQSEGEWPSQSISSDGDAFE